MGSKSRRFRASETVDSELIFLYLSLFLCLGFLKRSVDYGHTYQQVYRGALNLEQGPSEILATANPGAFVLEQETSEVIATVNSTSNKFGSIGEYSCAVDFLAEREHDILATMARGIAYYRISNHLIVDSSGGLCTLTSLWVDSNDTRFPGDDGFHTSPLFRIAFDSDLETPDGTFLWSGEYIEKWTLSKLYFGSGNVLSEYDHQRRPWFMVRGMEQIEVVINNKIPMGTSTESPLNLPSNAICLDSIQKIFSGSDQLGTPEEELVGYFLTDTIVPLQFLFTHLYKTIVHLLYSQGETAIDCSIDEALLRDKTIEIMGIIKKLCHIDELWVLLRNCFNKTVVKYYVLGLSLKRTLKQRAKVISISLAGIIIFVIILTMAWKGMKNAILFKSNNELDALILEESDLDESYLADQILYENLLKEAVLVSEGSSGKVFKVRFLELDCAMKVFHSNARMDFRKESITLLNLSHPHVVTFFCCFRKSFIIMELMDEDLYSFITKIRERRIDYDMPLEVALDVMLQIAEGMSYLHNQGIAHQDLKSLNVLLKLRGEFHDPDFQIIAKVADFGSARRFDPRYPKGFVLVPNMNIGTRSWRAPELFHPRGGFLTRFFGLNPRVLPKPLDIYGFAVICSELITKQIPFSNDKDLRVSVLASKLRESHRPALPSNGFPEGLLALIMDCWHRDPVLRPEFHEVRTRLIEVKSSWMSRGQRPES